MHAACVVGRTMADEGGGMATVLKIEATGGSSELRQRIDQIARDRSLLSLGELSRRADAVRGLAALNGMTPVARLAGGLADSLASDGRAAVVVAYCDAMRDVLAGDPYDVASGDAFLAAVSVRLG